MEGFDFPVEVVRTDRKRSASICLEGEVIKVRVPKSLSDRQIRELITKRTPWITTKLKEVSERPIIKPKEYVSGETFSYLGRNYRLKKVLGDAGVVKLKQGYLEVSIPKGLLGDELDLLVQSSLAGWYEQHALVRLREKTKRYASLLGVTPTSIQVKDYKSRWGSCSVKGDITYNWRIILAPHHIVDYVVVHELCHLLAHNHSSRYWKQVEKQIPDYKERREWLRLSSGSLSV